MKRKAFTLVELLVVISVMIILMAMMLPAIKSVTRNNSQKQAANMTTALLANARTLAIQRGKYVGLVFFRNPEAPGQTSTQLVVETSTTGTIQYFTKASDPQPFPTGMRAGMLDDASFMVGAVQHQLFRTDESTTNTAARIILFTPNGQMLLRNGLARDPSLTDNITAAWNLNATVGNESRGVSSPAVVIYSGAELQAAIDNGTATTSQDRALWIEGHSDVLVVNAYTGGIVR